MGLLVDREMTEGESRRLKDRLAKARLRQAAAVEDIDKRKPRGLDAEEITETSANEHLGMLIPERPAGLLTVDDHPLFNFGIGRLFSGKPWQLFQAERGEEALEIVDKRGDSILVMITDLSMPGMSGLELIDALVAKVRWPLAVIMLTVFRGEPYHSKFLGAASDHVHSFAFLSKGTDDASALVSHVSAAVRFVRTLRKFHCR